MLRSEAARLGDVNARLALAKSHMPLSGVADERVRDTLLRYLWAPSRRRRRTKWRPFLGCHYMPPATTRTRRTTVVVAATTTTTTNTSSSKEGGDGDGGDDSGMSGGGKEEEEVAGPVKG